MFPCFKNVVRDAIPHTREMAGNHPAPRITVSTAGDLQKNPGSSLL